jgi:hypothetical protein
VVSVSTKLGSKTAAKKKGALFTLRYGDGDNGRAPMIWEKLPCWESHIWRFPHEPVTTRTAAGAASGHSRLPLCRIWHAGAIHEIGEER